MQPQLTLGLFQGFLYADHRVPEGSTVLDLKQCENCPVSFTRQRGSTQRYCQRCRRGLLMPDVSMQQYKDMLPSEREQRHAHHLPKYDDSLLPKEQRVYSRAYGTPIKARGRRVLGDNWKHKLAMSFLERQALSAEEIKLCIGYNNSVSSQVLVLLRSHGFIIEDVGAVWPRKSCMGKSHRIYRLTEIVL